MKTPKVEYIGKDLEAMDFAENYHRWILGFCRPYLGKRIVEVGAGTGSFSELLMETAPATVALIEPSEMFDALQDKISSLETPIETRLFNDIFVNVSDEIRREIGPDSIVYINVLEHIEDDNLELETAHDCIEIGGHVCIFVPAMPALMSDFDRRIGHFRRYRKRELAKKCQDAGFSISSIRYFDLPGVLPWFIKYRLMRSLKMESGSVQLYDKAVVPIIKPVESIISPPFGKNLLVIAQKQA